MSFLVKTTHQFALELSDFKWSICHLDGDGSLRSNQLVFEVNRKIKVIFFLIKLNDCTNQFQKQLYTAINWFEVDDHKAALTS